MPRNGERLPCAFQINTTPRRQWCLCPFYLWTCFKYLSSHHNISSPSPPFLKHVKFSTADCASTAETTKPEELSSYRKIKITLRRSYVATWTMYFQHSSLFLCEEMGWVGRKWETALPFQPSKGKHPFFIIWYRVVALLVTKNRKCKLGIVPGDLTNLCWC